MTEDVSVTDTWNLDMSTRLAAAEAAVDRLLAEAADADRQLLELQARVHNAQQVRKRGAHVAEVRQVAAALGVAL